MTAAGQQPTTRTEATGIARAQTPSLILGIVGAIACIVGFFINRQEFFRAYLPSYLFWFEIVAGALGVLMLQYMTGGEWGVLIRRPLGAAARTMIVMAILFIPIALGVHYIYAWADPNIVAHDEVLQHKQRYLSVGPWLIRTLIYFGLWILWAWRIRFLSLRFAEDRAPETELARRKWAALGLPMIVLSLTFASIDWAMSLEPKWYSSMFGITFTVSCALSAYAYVIFLLTQLAKTKAMAGILKPSHFRDLGNLMLAFVMFWAYTGFSQFLLIWYGNIKEEVPYYLKREQGVWGFMAVTLILFHFFLPFFMLLMRAIKDRPNTIATVAVIILVMRYIHTYWLTGPAWYGDHFYFSWMSVAAFVGIGGIWFWALVNQLKGQTIIPIHETWVEEAIREGRLTVNA
ncbi:MAG TPA: hypothetical protein VGS96_12635 [Thermoanaerobaculia bacterium]|jgi:hypothetical protein|nr:hypothetical protein [Thermoanaerobaculia bacterium]